MVFGSPLSVIPLLVTYFLTVPSSTHQLLANKVKEIASKMSIVLEEPMRDANLKQVAAVLDSYTIDPDFLGAVVYDESGNTIASTDLKETNGQTQYQHSNRVRTTTGTGQQYLGTISVTLTDQHRLKAAKALYIRAASIVVLMVLVLAVILTLIYFRSIRTPLKLLREGIQLASDSQIRMPVSWQSNDQIGEVISAFNRLQLLQRDHEKELRAARDEEAKILEVANSISSELELDVLLQKIIATVTNLLSAERASLFLYDPSTDELWSRVSQGAITQEIRISATTGLAGACFESGDVLNISDPYSDPRFNREIDQRTGQKSHSILCIPVQNRLGVKLGVLQLVNKIDGEFTEHDIERLKAFSAQFAIALENAQLYEELRILDNAKEKVINHLSHELKTPLAILSGVLELIQRELSGDRSSSLDRILNRGHRNIRRLIDLQEKIDDILQRRPIDDKEQILNVIASAVDLVGDHAARSEGHYAEALTEISKRIESLFGFAEVREESVNVSEIVHASCDRAQSSLGTRKVEITRSIEDGLVVLLSSGVLDKACDGLLRNAIENIPDEGAVAVTAKRTNDEISIEVQDHGIGITTENQQMIFGGFFHTQNTEAYSSKRPYHFNAGGSGTDLLRIKCLAERFGFIVDFDSRRCHFIPREEDVCPGRISECAFVQGRSGCESSGGSRFSIKIPVSRQQRTGIR